MLPALPTLLQACSRRLHPFRVCRFQGFTAALLLASSSLGLPDVAFAQGTPDAPLIKVPAASADSERIAFEADQVQYDQNADVATATGNVILRRPGGQSLRTDTVTWNRNTGKIVATGNVRMVDEDGNQLYTDKVELTQEFKTGAMQNILLALREGGRLAANVGTRDEAGKIVLTKAAYTGCGVEDDNGCPKKPSWRITADSVIYDPAIKRVRFRGARMEVFGVSLLPLPGMSVSTDGKSTSGPIVPDFNSSPSNGVEIAEGWYQRLGENRDATITGHLFTDAPPMLSAQYRELNDIGAYQITGYLTSSKRTSNDAPLGTTHDLRGYVFANGRFQFSPEWSVTTSVRYASDRTFLRRYDISRDDRLRSMVDVEHITPNSYLSVAGWATQTMRIGDSQGQVPIALPVIDYRLRLADPILGGKVQLQANSLAIARTSGQDTQRAFASAQWDMRRLTGMGQEITLTALVRGDVYHPDENDLTATAIYRGNSGWQTRGVALAAVDVKWPFAGPFGGGTQIFTPRVQVVATPPIRNLAVPNEDARAIDLEDSNLFALNRFPGYDRIEDGVRFTYGFDWQWERPNWRVMTTIGQSYRLTRKPTLLPDGTGLSSRQSDIVGRTEVRYRDFFKITHRFRLDKDSLAVRRNEIDATIGNQRTYVEIGYLRLNRDITALEEDLQDREELRLAGRVAFAKYWSVFGSGVFNLTNKEEDPTFTADGFEPLRTRIGIAYQDDCLELALTWRRDFIATGDVRRGNSFALRVAFRNLGVR
jgi:LPS-assembly protein